MMEITVKGLSVGFKRVNAPEAGYNYVIKFKGTEIARGFTAGGYFRAVSDTYVKVEEALRKMHAEADKK